jgi:hypothetical protein
VVKENRTYLESVVTLIGDRDTKPVRKSPKDLYIRQHWVVEAATVLDWKSPKGLYIRQPRQAKRRLGKDVSPVEPVRVQQTEDRVGTL